MRLIKVCLISFTFFFIFGCSLKKRKYIQSKVYLELNDSIISLSNLQEVNSDFIESSPKVGDFSFIFTKIGFEQNVLKEIYDYYLNEKEVLDEILFIDFYIDKNVRLGDVVIKKDDVKNIGIYFLINKKVKFKYYQVPMKLLEKTDSEQLTCTSFVPYLYAQSNIVNNNFLIVRAHLKYSRMPRF